MKKRKRGTILILFGIGIVLLSSFLSSSTLSYGYSSEAVIDLFGFLVPSSYPIAVGALFALFGIGMIILSFFPEVKKPVEQGGRIIKKRKHGTILIFVGIGIILIASIFGGGIFRLLFPPYNYFFAVAIVVILVGIGMIILSFFPEEKKPVEKERTGE